MTNPFILATLAVIDFILSTCKSEETYLCLCFIDLKVLRLDQKAYTQVQSDVSQVSKYWKPTAQMPEKV